MDISIALSGEHLCSSHFLTINKESTLHSHLLSRMTINRVAIYIIPNHPIRHYSDISNSPISTTLQVFISAIDSHAIKIMIAVLATEK